MSKNMMILTLASRKPKLETYKMKANFIVNSYTV